MTGCEKFHKYSAKPTALNTSSSQGIVLGLVTILLIGRLRPLGRSLEYRRQLDALGFVWNVVEHEKRVYWMLRARSRLRMAYRQAANGGAPRVAPGQWVARGDAKGRLLHTAYAWRAVA
eukprot:7014694-Prymnesium_polylepis.1